MSKSGLTVSLPNGAKGDITNVGRIVPGGAPDGRDQFVDWAFDSRYRPGVAGVTVTVNAPELVCGWTDDELRWMAEHLPEGSKVILP